MKSPIFHARTKHIEIQDHFLCDKVETGEIELVLCPTKDMIVVVSQKVWFKWSTKTFKKKMGIVKVPNGWTFHWVGVL